MEGNMELLYFCQNVRFLRLSHNLSKTQMARIIGISRSTLSLMEQGHFPPRTNCVALWNICDYFQVSADELFVEGSFEK